MEYYLKSIDKHKLISREEERELLKKYKLEGDQKAREKLIVSNLRFVVSIAKQYSDQSVDLEDLVSIGNMGLIKGIDRFNVEKYKVRLITYAVWWIRQAILQALSQESSVIRVPLNKVSEKLKYQKTKDRLEQSLGRPATREEMKAALENFRDPVHIQYVELDKEINDLSKSTIMEVLQDTNAETPDEEILRITLRKNLDAAMEGFTDREKEIVYLYHGIDEFRSFTLEEIGNFLGLTRERVRQIKKKVLHRLSKSPKGRALKPYLESK